MTTATLPKKPPLMPWERPAEEPPKCEQCGRSLHWRDHAYVGKQTTMCKVCHQKAERKRLRGVYVPRERMPKAPMAYGTERTAKLTARSLVQTVKKKLAKANAAPKPAQKAPRWERSAKRAEKYLRRKARKEAAA